MIDKGLIDKLSMEMKEILEKELEAGNEIVETSLEIWWVSGDFKDEIWIKWTKIKKYKSNSYMRRKGWM